MAQRTLYRISHMPFDEGGYNVNTILDADIWDMESGDTDLNPIVIQLEGADIPVEVSWVDNEEDKFTPTRAREAVLRFNSTAQYNLNTFAEGTDTRWFVRVYKRTGQTLFVGYLDIDSLTEPFLPPPNVVELVAIDGLGLLKEIPLTTFTGINPKGKFRIIEFIAWALSKTSLQLNINVVMNLREESYPNDHAWNVIYLDAKTFEGSEVGVSLDCYTVLEHILKRLCFLTQWLGEWWIVRVDEMDNRTFLPYRFDHQGVLIGALDPVLYEQEIWVDGKLFFSEEATMVGSRRPYASVRHNYRFVTPKEIIDNIDFSRGDLSIIAPGPDWTAFDLADWTFKNGFPYSVNTPQSSVYIKRTYFEGYEKERYLVITKQLNANNNSNHVESNPIRLEQKDKFTISVDYRFPQEISNFSQSVHVMSVRLVGDDNTYWWLGQDPSTGDDRWFQSDANFGNNSARATYFLNFNDPNIRDTDWQTLTRNAPPLPIGGLVYVTLHAMNTRADFTQDNTDIYYQNLRFSYTAFINGAYQDFDGQYWKVSQSNGQKAADDDDVFISDGIRQMHKGAMLKKNGTKYLLTGKWFDWSLVDVPGVNDLKAFGWFQTMDVWNQKRLSIRVFDATLQGLRHADAAQDIPDLIHKYKILDQSPNTDDKMFMLLHGSVNEALGEWKGFLCEMYDSNKGKQYTDSTEFKFIESR